MQEYLVSYKEGTSPYWYNRCLWAESADAAKEILLLEQYVIPIDIKVVPLR